MWLESENPWGPSAGPGSAPAERQSGCFHSWKSGYADHPVQNTPVSLAGLFLERKLLALESLRQRR